MPTDTMFEQKTPQFNKQENKKKKKKKGHLPGLELASSAQLCSVVGLVYSGFGHGSLPELTEVHGAGMNVVQNLQKFRCG